MSQDRPKRFRRKGGKVARQKRMETSDPAAAHHGKQAGTEIREGVLKYRTSRRMAASNSKPQKPTRAQQRIESYSETTARLRSAEAEAGEVAFGNRAAFADWAGIHRSQITRLAKGQDVGGEPGWRIAGLVSVVLALLEVYEPDAVPGWLQGINPYLNNRRPLDVLAEGDVAKVMAAIQATRVGSYA